MPTDDLPLKKNPQDVTLDDLNAVLPQGWRATIVDRAKQGEFEPALILALGLDARTFYQLKRHCAPFNEALNECELWRLVFWQSAQKAMVFGDLPKGAAALLVRILDKAENEFAAMADAGGIDKKLNASDFTAAEIDAELERRGWGKGGLRLLADILDDEAAQTPKVELNNEPTDDEPPDVQSTTETTDDEPPLTTAQKMTRLGGFSF